MRFSPESDAAQKGRFYQSEAVYVCLRSGTA